MQRFQKGFSFIELMLVLAIAGLLVGVSLGGFSRMSASKALQADASIVKSVVEDARSRTLAARADSEYGVRFESTRVILFKGSSYVSGASTNVISDLNSRVSLSAALTGGGSEIIFERLTGKASKGGTVTVSVSGGATKILSISTSGIIEIQ
jgi:prepilin-type N-terminal cleavage/methylation domain-containing protein